MLEDTKIQPLTEDDLPAMVELQRMAYVPELHEPQSLFAAMLSFSRSICLGIRRDGALAGYVLGYAASPDRTDFTDGPREAFDPHLLYLHDLCIAIDAQGSGLGQALYDAFERRAREGGYTRIIANAIEGRLEFWENQGFTAGAQTAYHGVTATRIEKPLTQESTDS